MLTIKIAQFLSAKTSKIAKNRIKFSLLFTLFLGSIFNSNAQGGGAFMPDEITAKSQHNGFIAENLIDGDLTTKWNSKRPNYPNANNPEILTYYYETPQIIDSLVMTSVDDDSRTKDPTKFKIQGSNDDANWVDFQADEFNVLFTSASQAIGFGFENMDAYQYYRVVITEKVVPETHSPNSHLGEMLFFHKSSSNDDNPSDDEEPFDFAPLWVKAAATDPLPELISYTAGPVETGNSLYMTADENDEGVTSITFRRSNEQYSGSISVRDYDSGVNNMRFNLYNPLTGQTPGMKLNRTDDEAWLLINTTSFVENPQAPLHVNGNAFIDGELEVDGKGSMSSLQLGDFNSIGWKMIPEESHLLLRNGHIPVSEFKFHHNGDLEIVGNLLLGGDAIAVDYNQQGGDLEVAGDLTVLGEANIADGALIVLEDNLAGGNGSVRLNKDLLVFADSKLDGKVGVGTKDLHPDAILTVDGHVHISEDGGLNDNQWLATHDSTYLLWVEKGIVTEDIAFATPDEWMDIVFEEDYDLPSLEEVEAHIQENGYLPTMPSGKEVTKKGYSLHDMNKRMVRTIEELTLHTIAQEKKIDHQENQIDQQTELIKTLMIRLEALENQSNK